MTYQKRIPEHVVAGKRLGRHIHHDPRSLDHPAERATTVRDVWHKASGLPLDQGNRGSCTAQALCGALNSTPGVSPLLTEADANHLYDQEIALEGYPPSADPGGTGLYICKVGVADGLISSYQHAFGLQHALEALVLRPCITGVNWYEGFDNPDEYGFVKIAGQVRGGHEFVADAISLARKAVGCWNSWGPSWGPWGGRFWLPFAVWERLLGEGGDVTVPIR